MIEIKHHITGAVMHTVDAPTVKAAVETLVARGACLRGADLVGADLVGADLGGADLGGADLGDIKTASVQWSVLGAEGRTWLAVYLPALPANGDKPAREATTTYHCGCWSGTEAELRERIMGDGEDAGEQARLRPSRLLALDFLSARMAEMLEAK